jgi:2-hydroxychromene-2-carboxylate isomerase
VFKATGNDMPARIPAKARYLMEDLHRWAKHYGVPVQVPSRFPQPTLRTQRALAHVERTAPEKVGPFATGLFHASWRDDRDVNADDVIAELASAGGLDGASVVAAIDLPETKDQLRKTTDEAVARGAFGAPTFYVGDAMFFGNDRMELLEAHLRAV